MLLKKIFLITLILLIPTNIIAQDAVYLNQGDKAPYSGYLLDPQKAKEQRQIGLERDSYKQLNLSLNQSLDLSIKAIQTQKLVIDSQASENTDLRKAVQTANSSSTLEHILYFGLGALAATAAVWASSKINH